MSRVVLGQRWVSEREPELGLGVVEQIDPARLGIAFPAAGEKRLYARGTTVLKRVAFRVGDTVTGRQGERLTVEAVEEVDGLLVYVGAGQRLREDALSDATSVSSPVDRFFSGQTDPGAIFDLRRRALELRAQFRASDVRGLAGARIDLIAHQLYLAREVASRPVPRVLLADEVGLGKTIEAGLIVHRLLHVGRIRRVLVLVPEPLVHQWFVELLRRFNLWFAIMDAARCDAIAGADEHKNPFLDVQLALGAISFLTHDTERREQAVAAGWDLVVVDEAHHLEWTPTQASPEYLLVAELAARTPGLLLLTATPTYHGLEPHFARLRLLDPERYGDFNRFVEETAGYAAVAEIIDKILAQVRLTADDEATLRRIFDRDADRRDALLRALATGGRGPAAAEAREALIRVLLDQHGTGRVMFRNTRAAIPGFPRRVYCPAPIDLPDGAGRPEPEAAGELEPAEGTVSARAIRARIAREIEAEETGTAASIRYVYKQDPRVEWLAGFLREHRTEKVLLICRSLRKVVALGAALAERINVRMALFHEDLPLVQRDRHAAWFAEPDGAQLLICSEIGSEGRNFQFAHHLILFDLPLDPALVEQRIGRLDRIGQTQPIRLHVPFVTGSAQEVVADWYHRGLDAFAGPLPGGDEYAEHFRERVLVAALAASAGSEDQAARERLVVETAEFRRALAAELHRGRDRLLELNSFDPAAAQRVVDRIRATDADAGWRQVFLALLDQFGVRVREHEGGDRFLDPSHAYVEAFPSLPADGLLATFDRTRALAREDIGFLTPDHPLVRDTIDLLVDSPRGTTAFAYLPGPRPGLLLEVIFVLEAVAETRWQVDEYLPATPVRVLLDLAGRDRTDEHPAGELASGLADADVHRFLDRPGFDRPALQRLLERAQAHAEGRAETLQQRAADRARRELGDEVQRLVDLGRRNPHVRPEEIELARERLARTTVAVQAARLRMDSLRVILEGPIEPG